MANVSSRVQHSFQALINDATLVNIAIFASLEFVNLQIPFRLQGDKQSGSNDSGSTSAGQSPRLKSFSCRSLLTNDVSDA